MLNIDGNILDEFALWVTRLNENMNTKFTSEDKCRRIFTKIISLVEVVPNSWNKKKKKKGATTVGL